MLNGMKRLILILSVLFLCVTAVSAQDVIVKTDGENISADIHEIAPGMKYKELKHIYDYKDWHSTQEDEYSPALMGLCSFLIPGLGQMICDEVGRGFAWLGGAVGCYLLTAGTSAMGFALIMTGSGVAGPLVMFAGPIAMLTLDICAITDACRVAKVRNMYTADLEKRKYSLDLHPSVDCINLSGGVQPVAGLTLALKF
jgi:hypothetical protein